MRLSSQSLRVCAVLAAVTVAAFAVEDAREIVRRSVENNQADWKAAPQYSFTESDTITKGGSTTRRTYEVLMIEGSPYNRVVAENGTKLSGTRADAEQRKLDAETALRRSENPAARQRRIAGYERERHQDQALLREMTNAFDFRLAGRESVNGRDCYVLEASPRAAYRPTSGETKVLTGMRGKLWIDAREYQWVRVHAEVFQPVAFGLFIAHVQPGTEFTLEEAPVAAGVWMPVRFVTTVKASMLLWSRNYTDAETYSNYRRSGGGDQRAAASH